MGATVLAGKDCVVKRGANTVLGMGTWSLNGITSDQLEKTEFGDDWKKYQMGLKDGGTVSFSGLADPSDTTGQEALREANLENTNVTNLRLYINNTSYFEPNQTTGYFSPSTTSGASTTLSYVNITDYNVSADKSDLVKIDFSAKVSGCMVLV